MLDDVSNRKWRSSGSDVVCRIIGCGQVVTYFFEVTLVCSWYYSSSILNDIVRSDSHKGIKFI